MKKFLGHLWYSSEELLALAFFDNNVSLETKRKIVLDFRNETKMINPWNVHVLILMPSTKRICKILYQAALWGFLKLGIYLQTFLETDMPNWNKNNFYKTCKALAASVKAVKYVAERSVALMEEYNKLHTTDEEQNSIYC